MKTNLLFLLAVMSLGLKAQMSVWCLTANYHFNYAAGFTYSFDIPGGTTTGNEFLLGFSNGEVYVQPQNVNAVQSVSVTGGWNAVAFDSLDPIGPYVWKTVVTQTLTQFQGQGRKFLGLKKVQSGNTYYGWASIIVDASNSFFEFHCWTGRGVPNATLLAGQWTEDVGLFENSDPASNIQMFPNPVKDNGMITFENLPPLQNSKVVITDITGREIASINIVDKKISIKEQHLESGIYMIQLFSDVKKIYTRKIVIE